MNASKLSNIFVFFLLLRFDAFASSSSCNDLISGLSPEVQSVIHELAKLRLDLDQRAARGDRGTLANALQAQYLKKEAELLDASNIDRTILLEQIRSKVLSLQTEAATAETNRVEVKSNERDEIERSRQSIVKIGTLLEGRSNHRQSTLKDDRVVLIGGWGGSDDGKIQIFDLTTKQAKDVGKLINPRTGHEQNLLADDQILVVGGTGTGMNALKSIERVDSNFDSKIIGYLKHARTRHAQSLLQDDQVIVTGGTSSLDGSTTAMNSVEQIDPQTGVSKELGELKEARLEHAQSVLLDGTILVSGGSSETGVPGAKRLSSIEVFDPKTGESRVIGQLKFARAGHTQSVLPDGKVLVIGGRARNKTLDSIEIIDPKTGDSQVFGHLEIARVGHRQSVLKDGKILLTGGYFEGARQMKVLNSIELVDPQSATSEVILEMEAPKTAHAQSILSDGRIVITGGHNPYYLDSVEIIVVGDKQ